MNRLTDHFTEEEVFHSNTADKLGINNHPDDGRVLQVLNRAHYLAANVLEPMRAWLCEYFGKDYALAVGSWHREPEVNTAVGSTSKNSLHLSNSGSAADVGKNVDSATLWALFKWAAQNKELPITELIFEERPGNVFWIHAACVEGNPKRAISTTTDGRTYHPYQP